jgi:inorganic pyrophosphatase
LERDNNKEEFIAMMYDNDFWKAIDTLVSSGKIVIDRPKGSAHPRFPNIKYEVDYGYIENISSMDGGGIDVWLGSLADKQVNAIICTVDLMKKDSEIKLLIGCTEEEINTVYEFHNDSEFMKGILIRRG